MNVLLARIVVALYLVWEADARGKLLAIVPKTSTDLKFLQDLAAKGVRSSLNSPCDGELTLRFLGRLLHRSQCGWECGHHAGQVE